MTKAKFLAGAALAMTIASPASAAYFIDAAAIDNDIVVNYTGHDGNGTIGGLTAQGIFTLTSIAGSTFNFDYLIKNTSTLPITSSRVSVFGFNLSADPISASASTPFGTVASGNMPNVGNLDICFKTGGGPNCAGGGGGGVGLGDPDASGTFTLAFAPGTTSFNIEEFAVRYQTILPVPPGQDGDEGSASGRGTVTTAVPEPATWAMMILGFGIVGGTMRRQRAAVRYSLA